MNTLSRLDSFFASLGDAPTTPSVSPHASPSPSSSSTPYAPQPLVVAPVHIPVSSSSAVSVRVNGGGGVSDGENENQLGTSSTACSSSVLPRRLSNLPPRRRRRRRRPTGSSIKLPPPTTPLLVRIALALWSILLSFWRSLVGDTRAVRDRYKRRVGGSGSKLSGGSTVAGLPASGSAGAPAAAIPGLPAPSSSVADVASASSDEGTASEPEPSDREWVDPVTRAPPEDARSSDDKNGQDEFRPRTPTDATFSFRLRSAQNKETISITGQVDVDTAANGSATQAESSAAASPPFAPLARSATPPSSILQPRRRLLPNPMQTSLLDPSVPAVPHRSVTPSIAPPPRPHQTPFHLQKTLILDLDETLIHSTSRPIGAAHAGGGMLGLHSGLFGGGRRRRGEGHTVEVVLNGRSTTYHVYKRPYVDFFLKKVASWYTLVIFTASMPEYADPVIDWLDNGRGLFAKRLYRESCYLQPNGSYIKDLADVEPDLSKVCFMDNSPISYSWNKANALPIEGWTSDPNDEALLHSIPVLDSLRFVTDVRHILGIRGFM